MFGYIAPVLSVLSEEQKRRYRSFYCGLCHALRERHGQSGRLSLSNDMTFLAVLLSSLICAFYDAACFAWLFPSMAEKVNEAMSQSMSMMPAEGQSVMERMMDHYPRIAFISSFIKDFLIGLIVAAIANSSGKSKDPFAEEVKKEEDELA